jgi:hypothetical protein
MKYIIPLCFLSISLVSCDPDEDEIFAPLPVPTHAENALQGNWRITLFTEDGMDETEHFLPYTFGFDSTGSVSATSGNEVIQGTYLIFQDDGQTELAMQFPMNSALYELTDDWYFISQSDSSMHLADGVDVLKLERD